jgi:glycosyltransferase involved in cell wall biosynthesis
VRILFLGPEGVAHVTRWVRFLRERGHDVLLAYAHVIPHDEPCGGTPLIADAGTASMTPSMALRASRTARRLATKFQPGVVVSYYLTSYGLVASLAGLRPHVCATAGGDVLVDRFDRWQRRMINRVALAVVRRRTDRFLAWAPHVRDALVGRGVPANSIFVQPRGVSLDLFSFRPPRARVPGEVLRILSNRMLKPLYGLDVLIRALELLQTRAIPFEARICGEGPQRGELQAAVRAAGLETRVSFAGTVAASTMPDALAWTDVYVSTSYTDGASSSLFEAMAVGRFPVVTDLPANRPYVEQGASGMLFPAGDAEELARCLERLAVSPELCRSGGNRSRELAVEKLDYPKNMEAIEGVLREASRL